MGDLRRFGDQKTVVVTTYRRDGTPVDTPVHIAVDGGDVFMRTYESAMKWKRRFLIRWIHRHVYHTRTLNLKLLPRG